MNETATSTEAQSNAWARLSPGAIAVVAGVGCWYVMVDRTTPGWASVLHPVACFGHAAFFVAIAGIYREWQNVTAASVWTEVQRDSFDVRGSWYMGLGLASFVLGLVAVFVTWRGERANFLDIQPLLASSIIGSVEAILIGVSWLGVRRRRPPLPPPEVPKIIVEPQERRKPDEHGERGQIVIDPPIEKRNTVVILPPE